MIDPSPIHVPDDSYRLFLESLGEGAAMLDAGGKILYANPHLAHLLHTQSGGLLGSQLLDWVIPSQTNVMRAFLVTDALPVRQEFILNRKDGSHLRAMLTLHGMAKGDGACFGLLVNEQEEIQEFLPWRPEDALRTLLCESVDIIALRDKNLRFRIVNELFCALIKKTEAEIIGKTYEDLIPESYRDVILSTDTEVLRTRAQVSVEMHISRPEIDRWYSIIETPITNHRGESVGIISIGREISEQKRIELALRTSEEKFAKAFNANPVAMVISTLDDPVFVEVNDAYCATLGVERSDVIGKRVLEYPFIVPQEVIDAFQQKIEKNGVVRNQEICLESGDGEDIYVLFSTETIVLDGIPHLLTTATDITERKRAEAEISKQAALIKSLLNSIPDMIFVKDTESIYLGCNPAFAAYAGKPETEIVGKTDFDLFDKETADFFREKDRQMLANCQSCCNDEWVTYPDGHRVLLETTKTPYWGPDGALIGILGISRDITQKRQIENALRESEERYRQLAEDMPLNIATFLPDGKIFYANNSYTAWRREEQGSLIGKNLFDLLSPEEAVAAKASVSILTPEMPINTHEQYYLNRNGDDAYHEWTNRAFFDAQGNVTHFQLIGQDITERKKTEETQRFLLQNVYQRDGEDFFSSLARFLAEKLKMDYVCIDRLEGDGLTARTEAIYFDGRFEDNVTYALKDTPCGKVVGRTVCSFPQQVRGLFPNDLVLQEMKAESYVGVTLWDSKGKPNGLIAVIGRRTLADPQFAESILKLVAVRAAGELERQDAERQREAALAALQESEERYRTMFEDSPISLRENDFSAVKRRLVEIQASGVSDMRAYLEEHPDVVAECAGLVRLVDVNKATLRLHGALAKDQMPKSLTPIFNATSYEQFREELVGISEGVTRFDKEVVNQSLDGKQVDLHMTWIVAPGHKDDLSKVIISMLDISERKRVEEALRESERRLAEVIDFFPDAFFAIDADRRVILWNRMMETMTGVPASEMLGKANQESMVPFYGYPRPHLMDLFWEPDPELLKKYSSISYEGDVYIAETFCPALRNGTGAYVWGKAAPLRDSVGKLIGVVESIRDITERKEIEDNLKKAQGLLQGVFDILPVGLWIADKDGVLIQSNAACRRIWGGEPLVGIEQNGVFKAWRLPSGEEIAADDWALVHTVREGVTILDEMLEIQTLDGQRKTILNYTAPVLDENGAVLNAVVVNLDISERRMVEERLRLQAIALEAAANAIVITDPDGTIQWVNPAYEYLTGYSAKEAIGKNPRILKSGVQDAAFYERLWKVILSGQVWQSELVNKRKDGSLYVEEEIITPLCDANRRITHFIGIKQDISERKETEEKLRVSQKFADLGTLAAGMAHEMNTPLQVITGSAGSLLKTLVQSGQIPPERLRGYLENISRNSWRIADLVRALNIYARPTDSQMDYYAINDLVNDVLVLIEHQLKTWSNVTVTLHLAKDIPQFRCNRNDITQVLINLMTNARDAMPQGGVITLVTYYTAAGDEVVIEVRDNGNGIPPEIQERIFDPFFTTKPIDKGTGLGLSIVHGIVRNYRGRIELESSPGSGTIFRLFFKRIIQPQHTEDMSSGGGRY